MEDSNIQNLNEETTCSAEYLNGEFFIVTVPKSRP